MGIIWISTLSILIIRMEYLSIRMLCETRNTPMHWRIFTMWHEKNLTEKGAGYRKQYFRNRTYFWLGGITTGIVILILQALDI